MADMQHTVLSSCLCDEYNPYANAMAEIANTAVSDQYLFPTLVSDIQASRTNLSGSPC
jgi:hypothetical protein